MKLNRTLALAVCAVALLGVAGHTAEEQTKEPYRWAYSMNGMGGLRELEVAVSDIDQQAAQKLSLTADQLETMTRLHLHSVPGLTVVDSSLTRLQVRMISRPCSAGTNGEIDRVAIYLALELAQVTRIPREIPEGTLWVHVRAVTWQGELLMTGPADVDTGKLVRDSLEQLLVSFENEYLKANPEADT